MKKDLPLVSLITPCYNGAGHLRPYLNGVLHQTYPNVQYIFINDGSTDETEAIILSHKEPIEAKGWDFVYVKQENVGQATAVNNGLSLVKGKYFAQVDSDDIMYPHYLEKYCNFLETHPDCKFCYARVDFVNEDALGKIILTRYRDIKDGKPDNFFNDLILMKNVPPLPFYMVDTKAFFDVVKLPIFRGEGGQNWQILLPMAHKYKCGYIDDILAKYVVRKNSHSHSRSNQVQRTDDLKQILFNTIARIDMPEGEKAFWHDKITTKYIQQKNKTKFRLFGFIPFLKIKGGWVYLFEFLPIGKIKG